MASSFNVNLGDLTYILKQIKIAERHAAGEDLATIIGSDAALLPMGLRTVDGSYNHLLPGTEQVGAADQLFPRLLPAKFRLETDGDSYTIVRADVPGAPPGGITITNGNYDPTIAGSHSVADADLRIISNLIVDSTLDNPSALQAALGNAGSTNAAAEAAAITALHVAAKEAARDASSAQITQFAYQAAAASAQLAADKLAASHVALQNLLSDMTVDAAANGENLQDVATFLADIVDAIEAQQAIVKTLQFEANANTSTVTEDGLASAKVVLAVMHALHDGAASLSQMLTLNAPIEQAAIDQTNAATTLMVSVIADMAVYHATLEANVVTATAESFVAADARTVAIAELTQEVVADGLQISSDGSITIENRSPDIGLSPGFNGWMTFFGQFFDHGLDLVTKGNNGTVYIPLEADDPLYDKGQDGLIGAQQVRDVDGNLTFASDGVTPVLHNDDGYGADGILGTVDDRPNFMALTRATTFVDPLTGLKTETQNTTTPFIDQNQTYTSNASHQVFLREYAMADIAGDAVDHAVAVSTGRLLDGEQKGSIASWADVKAQAATKLGLKLGDFDVADVPKLLTDQYGKFIAGDNGFAQVFVNVFLVNLTTGAATPQGTFLQEGAPGGLDLANLPLPTDFTGDPVAPEGFAYHVATVRTGHAFLNDIAHHAEPVFFDSNGDGFKDAPQTADLDIRDVDHDGRITQVDIEAGDHDVNGDGTVDSLDLVADDFVAGTYDDEMLDAHFITGDGRGNENIGLTAVHTVFHAEHNRLTDANKATLIASGDAAVVNEWLLAPGADGVRDAITQSELDTINAIADPAGKVAAIESLQWDGERIFQAARFATEMQYQHLVFEEFGRKIQPNIDPFVFTNSADLDPSIVAEFAHVVYRFGHSMLTDTVDRLDNNLEPVDGNPQLTLIEAFLNPQAFTASGTTAAEAAGSVIRGMTRQIGNEIDEFVVEGVRSNLVGLPLDLAALNMARARDTGVPTFNDARAQFYEMTGDAQLKPYDSWFDFAQNIKNPISIINFIAAYGQHDAILRQSTAAGKREAATVLVLGDGDDTDGIVIDGITYLDRVAFLNANGPSDDPAIAWTATTTGLNSVDLWIGGLAEAKMEFGGMLGSTFNFVFETQLENLQNGDRMYYLSRTQGMNLLNQLEPNTFADIVMRNTDLGDLHATHVNATLFDTADAILELDPLVAQEDYNGNAPGKDPVWEDLGFHLTAKVVRDDPNTSVNEKLTHTYLKFTGGEHVVLGGSENNDRIYGDKGIDTLWGDGGNDYLNAGSEADQVFGGDGDDIIEDPFGDGDFLRGNLGNDVVVDSHGFGDVLFGDAGKDFVAGGSDVIEIFAGEGDDFVLGGVGGDGLLGNEGSDWIEGGEGFDSLSGDNSDLFFNSPIIGHDVLNGQGNDTDYDGETGDDIMVQGAGIQRNNGMLGFDWVIQKGDPNVGTIDLGISRFANQQALTLRDRNDSVEGASGWKFADTVIGTNAPTGAVGGTVGGIVGGPATDSMLLSQNVALISGLETFLKLTPGALRGQTAGLEETPFAGLESDTVVFNPQSGGDILLGGAGSDLMYGKAGNDLIDGDRWLNVRIEVHANRDGSGPLVTNLASVGRDGSVDSLNEIKADLQAGRINPGQLQIVRELITTGATADDTDVAFYAGRRSDYTVTRNANGTTTVVDNVTTPILVSDPQTGTTVTDAALGNEGTDTISNIEILRFTDRDAAGVATGTFTELFIAPRAATGTPSIIDANGGTPTEGQALNSNTATIQDQNGLGNFAFQWQAALVGTPADGAWTNIAGATASTFTPGQAQVGQILRVVTSFVDGIGVLEQTISPASAGVGDLYNGGAATDVPTLTGFDDVANGNGGADRLSGLAGDDVLNGGTGNDILTGGFGRDRVSGDAGDDTLLALTDDGDDTYDGGAGIDTYDLSATAGGVTITTAGTVVTATGVEIGTDTLINIENFLGSSGSDFIQLNGANNVISGLAGADTIYSGAGNDIVNSGDGNDVIDGELGNDTLTGGAGDDVLRGGGGDDTFEIGAGAGTDIIDGGAGTDRIRVTTSSFIWANVTSIEQLTGFNLRLNGTNGNDLLDFSAVTLTGVSKIYAGAGNDTVVGSAGADVIELSAGRDVLTGGAGADIFDMDAILESRVGALADLITDFRQGSDKISLTDVDASTRRSGNQAFTFVGEGAFTGVAGQLRFTHLDSSSTSIMGDIDGDEIADFQIDFANYIILGATDFFL